MKRTRHRITQMLLKSRMLVVCVPLLYCALFLTAWRIHESRETQNALNRKTVQEETVLLLRMGCTEEAMERLRGERLDPTKKRSLLIEVYMQKNQMDRVENLLLEEPIQARFLEWQRLLSRVMQKKQWVKAYSICLALRRGLSEEALLFQVRQTTERLLAQQEKQVLSGEVIASWRGNPQRAILRDERGCFLVDEFGEEAVKGRRFPNLRYGGDNIFVVNGSMFRFEVDGTGRVKKWAKKAAVEKQEEEQSMQDDGEAALDVPIVPFGRSGAMGYETANGAVVVEALYDELSPVSLRGVGFGKADGRWYMIRFPALFAH
ncbi:MAG: hypothetical protein SOR89_02420 [Ndongobacter sp.]|nr:hypothetical protein [Ndongobacter sp.]